MKHYALSKTASKLQLESLKNFQNLIKSTITYKAKDEGKTDFVSYDSKDFKNLSCLCWLLGERSLKMLKIPILL